MDPDQTAWANVIRHVATSTALNPTIILALIATPTALILSVIAGPPLAYWLLAIAAGPIIVGLLQILGFSLFDRDRLQDSKHVQRMTAMMHRLGTRQGDETKEIQVPPATVLIDNPATRGNDSNG